MTDEINPIVIAEPKKRGRKLGQKDTKPRLYKHFYRRRLRDALKLNKKPLFGRAKLNQLIQMKESGFGWKVICKKLKASQPYLVKRLREVRPDLINIRGYHWDQPIIQRAEWAMILKLREKDRMTFEQIAKIYGVSRERIRQILKIMKPELTGYITGKTYVCEACGATSPPAHPPERKAWVMCNIPKAGHPELCPEHWPIFNKYKRIVGRLYVYHKDYMAINKGLSEGMKMAHIGEQLYPHKIKKHASIAAYRVRKFYEDAQALMVKMEVEYPRLRGVYEKWAEGKTPAQINYRLKPNETD